MLHVTRLTWLAATVSWDRGIWRPCSSCSPSIRVTQWWRHGIWRHPLSRCWSRRIVCSSHHRYWCRGSRSGILCSGLVPRTCVHPGVWLFTFSIYDFFSILIIQIDFQKRFKISGNNICTTVAQLQKVSRLAVNHTEKMKRKILTQLLVAWFHETSQFVGVIPYTVSPTSAIFLTQQLSCMCTCEGGRSGWVYARTDRHTNMLTDGQGIQPLISLTDEYYPEQILRWHMSDHFSS